MTWLIIAVVLLGAFGPVLWLVPSRRDRRLAALRSAARQQGLVVELARLPNLAPRAEERVSAGGQRRDAVIECAQYRRVLPAALRGLPSWRLRRGGDPTGAAELAVSQWPGRWGFEHAGRPPLDQRMLAERMLDATASAAADLPEDVIAVAFEPRQLTAYWLEKPGADAEALAEALDRMAEALAGIERQRQSEEAAGNPENPA